MQPAIIKPQFILIASVALAYLTMLLILILHWRFKRNFRDAIVNYRVTDIWAATLGLVPSFLILAGLHEDEKWLSAPAFIAQAIGIVVGKLRHDNFEDGTFSQLRSALYIILGGMMGLLAPAPLIFLNYAAMSLVVLLLHLLVKNPTVLYWPLLLLGWSSILSLVAMFHLVRYDGFVARHQRRPTQIEMLEVVPLGLLGAILCLWLPFCVRFAPLFMGVMLISGLIYRRMPAGSDFWGRPTHRIWVIRFGLLEIVLLSLIIGTMMGWVSCVNETRELRRM